MDHELEPTPDFHLTYGKSMDSPLEPMLTEFMGLPFSGGFFPAGVHQVPMFRALNTTYTPCWLVVKQVGDDPEHTKITAYGMQLQCLTQA